MSIDVLANDTDPDGDPLTIDPAPYPVGTSNGLVDIDVATGRLLYTANNGFVGPETFTYDVTDGMATSTATVRVFVGFHSNVQGGFTFGSPGTQLGQAAVLGEPTSYGIYAENASSFPAHDVTITNRVPANFDISVSNTTDCLISGNDITCHWDVLPPFDPTINNSVGTTVDLMPLTTGLFTNFMTITSLEDDPAEPPPTSDYTSSVYQSGGTADLGTLAFGPPATSSIGDHVVMSFNGQNYGPSVASDVVLTDTIPANFRIDSISNPTDCAVTGNTVTCQRATLPGFFETAVFLTAVSPGAWTNTATITSATPEAAPEYAANTWSTSGTVAGPHGDARHVDHPVDACCRSQEPSLRRPRQRVRVRGTRDRDGCTERQPDDHVRRLDTSDADDLQDPGRCRDRPARRHRDESRDGRPPRHLRRMPHFRSPADADVGGTGCAAAACDGECRAHRHGLRYRRHGVVRARRHGQRAAVRRRGRDLAHRQRDDRIERGRRWPHGQGHQHRRRLGVQGGVQGERRAGHLRGHAQRTRPGVTRQVVINGARFATPSPAVSFGPGVTVVTVVRNSASKLTVSVTVNPSAAIGPRDLTVTNPDGGMATRVAAIRIL